jgi:hypothetical protein
MGAILELVNLMQTPLGMIATVIAVTGAYFFLRWIVKE